MRTDGNATPFVGGTASRPLPRVDLTHRHSGQAESWTCPTDGCGFTARRQTFHLCVTAPAPVTKSGRVFPVAELTEEQVEKRFTPDAPVPIGTIGGTPVVASEAGVAAAEREHYAEPKPRVRAKVAAAKPGPGVLIALSGAVSTVEVTAVLSGLLEALNGIGKAARTPVEPRAAAADQTKLCYDGCGTIVARRNSRCPECKRKRRRELQQAYNAKRNPGTGRGTGGGRGNNGGRVTARIEEVERRYLAGESLKELAADLDVTSSAVGQALKRRGIALRTAGDTQRGAARAASRALTEAQAAECADLYVGGLSMLKLAEHYGISENGVRQTLRRLGIPARPASRRAAPSEVAS
jgi:DNA-binding CsgD family transcriptional regulator